MPGRGHSPAPVLVLYKERQMNIAKWLGNYFAVKATLDILRPWVVNARSGEGREAGSFTMSLWGVRVRLYQRIVIE